MFEALIALIKDLFTWWIVVTPWEQGIRVRMGKHTKRLEPGLHTRIPIIDRMYVKSIRLRYITIPTQTLTTKTGKSITVSGGLKYHIEDILKLFETMHDPESTIQLMVCNAIAMAIILGDEETLNSTDIEEIVNASLSLEENGLADVTFGFTDWAIARTYRLIGGEPKNWGSENALETSSILK